MIIKYKGNFQSEFNMLPPQLSLVFQTSKAGSGKR